jgi:atypical dual specificity phosphatase
MVETCGFYWLIEGKLSGSGYPGPCLDWLYQKQGIRAILSLHPLEPNDLQRAQQLGIQIRTIAIPDFTAGMPEQHKAALEIIDTYQEKNLPTLVHCSGGLGRTGMILALYLVHRKDVPPESAITQIRELQPGSIESNTGQEEAILAVKKKANDFQESA